MAASSEEEEFEFRLRAEQESASAPESYLDQFMRVIKTPTSSTVKALGGLGEAALTMGTGLDAALVGGYRGLGELVTGGGVEGAAEAVRGTQEALTYQPRTPQGQAAVTTAGLPIELASKGLGYVGGEIGGLAGPQGRIAGEAIGEVIPPIAGTLLGGRQAQLATKGVTGKDVMRNVLPERVPVLTPILEGVRDVMRARETNNAGHIKLAESYLRNLAKDATPQELQMITSSLERRGGEVVAGSPATSADALARANREVALKGQPERFGGQYVALEQGLARVPETSKVLTDVKLRQEQARSNVLERGAGTEAEMAADVAARSKATKPLYKQVSESKAVADVTRVDKVMDNLIGKSPANKDLVTALKGVKESLYDEAGALRTNPGQLHSAVENINIMLSKAENKPKIISSRLMLAKKMLEHEINKVEKAQGLATRTYAEKSIPINQKQLWGKMRDKFINATGKESPGVLLRSLKDEKKLIKEATGFKRGSGIDEIFDAKQSSQAAKLVAEMEMELTKTRMANEVNVPGVGRPAEGIEPRLPNMLMRETMIANFLLRKLSRDANVDVNIAAVNILKDPKLLSSVLKTVKKPHRNGIMKTIQKIAVSKPAATTGAVIASEQQ